MNDAPTSSSSGSGDVAPTQSSSSSSSTSKMSVTREEKDARKPPRRGRQRRSTQKDPERDDGKWMRTDGNKRKAGEESEESRLRKTVRYLKELDKMENKKESGKSQEVVEVAEVEVNVEEEEWMTEEESRQVEEGGDLDPEQVRQGREEEIIYISKTLKMFEFESWEEATSKAGKMPHNNETGRPEQEGRQWENLRQAQTGGA